MLTFESCRAVTSAFPPVGTPGKQQGHTGVTILGGSFSFLSTAVLKVWAKHSNCHIHLKCDLWTLSLLYISSPTWCWCGEARVSVQLGMVVQCL
jgi:hypothetical protein